ncbi:uncharacterized protein PHA67_016903 isoform 1-T2 [Liasis olivaceus]
MEKCSLPLGTIKEFLNRSPSQKDCMDLSGAGMRPQYWEVWQQVLLPTSRYKETNAKPPKILLDDNIQVCVVSFENAFDSFKEKEAKSEGMVGPDCVITIEEEVELQEKSSPESGIELGKDIKRCIVPELQEKTQPMVIDGGRIEDFTESVEDMGLSRVEKATQTEVTQMDMVKICENYIQNAEGSKDTLEGNNQASGASRDKPGDSKGGGVIHLTDPDGKGEIEEVACNNLKAGDKGDKEGKETAILKEGGIVMETARQSFRWYCYQEGEGPQKAYGQLLDLCHHWLKPEKRSKEEILELLILEQFLAILPKEIQSWVWQQHPETCTQAVDLVENFLTGLSLLERHGKKALVTFEEVSMDFSAEEWRLLDETQRKIYTKVMLENYENIQALGFPMYKPDLIFQMGRSKNHELSKHEPQNSAEGPSPEIADEVELSRDDLLATRREEELTDVLPPGPTSPRPLDSCNAAVKGSPPSRERARSRRHQTVPCFACPDCGKAFLWQSDLAQHRFSHSREKPYQGLSFPKNFAQCSELAWHQRQQTGELSCKCPKCGKHFGDRYKLGHHQKIHSAERPFCCRVRGRGFYFSYNLRQRQRVHTEERPYGCAECGRHFTRRSNLAQHFRVHQ